MYLAGARPKGPPASHRLSCLEGLGRLRGDGSSPAVPYYNEMISCNHTHPAPPSQPGNGHCPWAFLPALLMTSVGWCTSKNKAEGIVSLPAYAVPASKGSLAAYSHRERLIWRTDS